MSTIQYSVTGMTCGHCEAAVRDEVGQLDGVTVLSVSAADNALVIDAPDELDDALVVAAVDEAGYVAVRS